MLEHGGCTYGEHSKVASCMYNLEILYRASYLFIFNRKERQL